MRRVDERAKTVDAERVCDGGDEMQSNTHRKRGGFIARDKWNSTSSQQPGANGAPLTTPALLTLQVLIPTTGTLHQNSLRLPY